MGSSLAAAVNRRTLRAMAGGRSFERGEDYFANGQVKSLAEYRGTVTAKVMGTREYRVKLWPGEGALLYSCTCPVGEDGAFCKHSVAAGLAWLAQEKGNKQPPRKPPQRPPTMDEVRAYLLAQDKDTLVEVLMEQVLEDDALRRRLSLKAARVSRGGLDLDAYRGAIDSAVETDGFVDYGSAHDYARGIAEVIDSIEDLLETGRAADIIELTEYALGAVENALAHGGVDDSNGYVGDLLRRLQEMHLAACKRGEPAPEALAKRLFEWELHGPFDTFFDAVETYADILGEKGLAAYRRLAEAEWARVPSVGPGTGVELDGHWRITRIMESLAQQSGDVEALVAIKGRDLSHPYAYFQIAEIYKRARRHDLALEWAERGVRAFPKETDSRLREFLANEYHRRKRHNEAMALIWQQFTEAAGLSCYGMLKAHADRIGQWPTWREKALAFIRKQIDQSKRETGGRGSAGLPAPDHSELVAIFLLERDIEAAWREAQAGGCADHLWLDLAAKREKSHPADALAVFQEQVERTLRWTGDDAYRRAVGLLRKVRALMIRLHRKVEFSTYLESLRTMHKRKRNFIGRLDRAKWT